MAKVIAKFTDGSTYTWKNRFVDGYVEWNDEITDLWTDEGWKIVETEDKILHSEDLLCIIEKDEGVTSIWTNPNYDNVHINIETGKKRNSYDKVKKPELQRLKMIENYSNQLDSLVDIFIDSSGKILDNNILITWWKNIKTIFGVEKCK